LGTVRKNDASVQGHLPGQLMFSGQAARGRTTHAAARHTSSSLFSEMQQFWDQHCAAEAVLHSGIGS